MSKGAGEILLYDYNLIILRVMSAVCNAKPSLAQLMYNTIRPYFHSNRKGYAIVYSWSDVVH